MLKYGAATLLSASDTLLTKLEVLQTTAIWAALGPPKWLPNIILRQIPALLCSLIESTRWRLASGSSIVQ